MKRLGKFFSLFVVLWVVAALAGCASLRDVLTDQTSPQIAELKQQNKVLAGQIMDVSAQVGRKADRAEVAAVAASQEKTAAALAETAKSLGEVKGTVGGLNAAVADLNTRANNTDIALVAKAEKAEVAAVHKRVTGVEASASTKLAALEKRVVGVRAMAAGAIGRIGALEDTQGVDYDKRLFRLSGFPTAKYDEKEGKLTACAEISEGMKKKLAEVAALKKAGWEVKAIAGFADERPFRGKDGKILEKSDELNSKCAAARAEAVAKVLEVQDFEGRGATAKFGGLDMNRSVLIYLERKPAAPAAPAPAPAPPAVQPPAAQPPAPTPTK